jgi:predicted dehydrogenase
MAVIGAGWWATQFHIPSLLANPSAEIVAVVDKNPAQLQAVKEHFGIESLYTDHVEMLNTVRPDGAVVALPHALHYPIGRDVLDAGVNMMMEKPFTLTSADAWDLVQRARDRGLILTVGYPWNATSHAKAAREAVQSGSIGEIQLVSGLFASMVIEYLRGNPEAYRNSFKFPVTGPGEQTYSNPELAGGGQGHLQVTHLAGLMFWVTGLRPVEVFAFMEKYDLRVDLVDAIAIRFNNGAVGTLASTGGIAPPQQQDHEIRIYGTQGSIILNPIPGELSIHYADGRVQNFPDLGAESYPESATSGNLVEMIVSGAELPSPGSLGAITVDLLDAAYRSAASGQKEIVEEHDPVTGRPVASSPAGH